ncbi:MAG: hypothetical protein IAF58_17520, partial [Leptolyngbya sp.]|nr:hypothetical protein [Candidatus Melainabacteria bacterium]
MSKNLLLLLTAFQIASFPCLADNEPPVSASTPVPTNEGSSSRTPEKPQVRLNPPMALQGNIQGGATEDLEHIHDIGVTVHHLEQMLKGLLYEAQRQDMVVVAEPDVIGPMIIPAIPGPSGMLSMGYLPPRKKWVDYYMGEIEQLIPMLDHELNSMPRPAAADADMEAAFVKMFNAARAFNPPWSLLETATKGPDYKNADISSAGSGLWFQLKEFKEQNTLLLSGSSPQITEIENYIKQIDKLVPMVLIEV